MHCANTSLSYILINCNRIRFIVILVLYILWIIKIKNLYKTFIFNTLLNPQIKLFNIFGLTLI